MKTKFSTRMTALGVIFSMMSIPSFAQSINDDLTPVDIEISQETQEEIRRGLQGLAVMNTGIHDDVPDTISVPDYKPVYYAMRSRIVTSLTKFTLDVQNIHNKVKKDLNKVSALESMRDSSPQFRNIYNEEAKKAYEKIGSYLNDDYQNAIKNLYKLNGMLDLAVTQNKNNFKDLFKEQHSGRTKLESMCSTSLCLGKVTKDTTEWIKLVDSMNVNVDIKQDPERITFTNRTSSVTSINHFSSAINDFTNSLIRVGLKPNTAYSSGEAAATYLGQIGRSTFGVAFALVTFPAKVINSAFRGILRSDLSKEIMIKDLSLNKVQTYNIQKSVEDMISVSMKLETKTSVAAGDAEIRKYLKTALDKYPSDKNYIIKNVLPADVNFKNMIEKFYPEYLAIKNTQNNTGTISHTNHSPKQLLAKTLQCKRKSLGGYAEINFYEDVYEGKFYASVKNYGKKRVNISKLPVTVYNSQSMLIDFINTEDVDDDLQLMFFDNETVRLYSSLGGVDPHDGELVHEYCTILK